MNIKRIKKLTLKKGLLIKDLCTAMGMTPQNFAECVKNNNMSGRAFEKAAIFLNEPISFLFNEKADEIDMLKQRIKDLEEIIKLLKEKR